MRSEDHPPVLSMTMRGTPASLAVEEDAARVLLLCSERKRLEVHFKYSILLNTKQQEFIRECCITQQSNASNARTVT